MWFLASRPRPLHRQGLRHRGRRDAPSARPRPGDGRAHAAKRRRERGLDSAGALGRDSRASSGTATVIHGRRSRAGRHRPDQTRSLASTLGRAVRRDRRPASTPSRASCRDAGVEIRRSSGDVRRASLGEVRPARAGRDASRARARRRSGRSATRPEGGRRSTGPSSPRRWPSGRAAGARAAGRRRRGGGPRSSAHAAPRR